MRLAREVDRWAQVADDPFAFLDDERLAHHVARQAGVTEDGELQQHALGFFIRQMKKLVCIPQNAQT